MKLSATFLLTLTTLLLVTVTIFAAMDMSFSWVFYLTVLGQSLFLFTVYKVLTDDYQTTKTFKDFYRDRPDLGK